MSAGTIIAWLGALWLVVGCAIFAASVFGALLQRRIRRPPDLLAEKLPVTLILPVKLINPGFERAQRSAFTQDHPSYEVLVGTVDPTAPALIPMEAQIADAAVPARIVLSAPRGAMSPKLDTLAAPIEQAAHDHIVTKDSNITFAPDTLSIMLRALTPDVGLVCAVPVAVRPESFAGAIEAVLINRDARLLLTAAAAAKGYGVGKVMAFRRNDFLRAGGLSAISYTIAEDTALCRAMEAIGLRTVFADETVDQEIGARSLAEVYGRQARWAAIRRAEEPRTFAFEPMACPLPAAIAAALAAPLAGIGAAAAFLVTLACWYAAEVAATAVKGWELRPWTPAAFIGRDLVLLGAWVHAWTTREVVWAGQRRDVRDVLRRPQ